MSFYGFIVIAGIVSTALFLLGCVKGMRDAVVEYGTAHTAAEDVDRSTGVGLGATFAFIASAAIITFAGLGSSWIYAGAILNIVTTLAVAAAFFMDRDPRGATA